MEVSKTLAAQIVHAVYEVVKTDTNLISPSGHIVGSTDPDRIGSFHAAGAYVRAQSRGSTTPSFSTTLPSP